MISAAPTIVTIETNSAWVVIVAVSLVTFPIALFLRRLIDRPGALASSLLPRGRGPIDETAHDHADSLWTARRGQR